MLHLKDVSLLCVDGLGLVAPSLKAIEASTRRIRFHRVTLLTANRECRSTRKVEVKYVPRMSWADYNAFSISRLSDYFDSDFVLTIQDDGYVSNPRLWSDEFLRYDYIGAPWDVALTEQAMANLRRNLDSKGRAFSGAQPVLRSFDAQHYRVGNSGFCLRSRRLCEFTRRYDGKYPGQPDDNIIGIYEREELQAHGFRIAPLEVAGRFAVELPTEVNPTADQTKTFGFHGRWLVPRKPPSALLRRLRMVPWAINSLLRHPLPRHLIQFDGGIGDALLCSVVCRELRRRQARGIWMETRHPELFAGNPDVDRVLPPDPRVHSYARKLGARLLDPRYNQFDPSSGRHLYKPGHQLAAMCAGAGIEGEITLRPYLSLSSAEQEKGKLAPRQIVMQSSGAAARFPIRNKEWIPERFAQVAAALAGRFDLVQLGAPQDPLLPGVRDLRGKTTVRESAAILSQAQLFIGLEGFLMHLARAVECRAVIVYGGHTHPAHTGYTAFENLYSAVPCAPCWLRDDCPHDQECMRRITVSDVLAGVERQLEHLGLPLPEETTVVGHGRAGAGLGGQG
jgi:ADP-heptose:LPS heptosyltransferase